MRRSREWRVNGERVAGSEERETGEKDLSFLGWISENGIHHRLSLIHI